MPGAISTRNTKNDFPNTQYHMNFILALNLLWASPDGFITHWIEFFSFYILRVCNIHSTVLEGWLIGIALEQLELYLGMWATDVKSYIIALARRERCHATVTVGGPRVGWNASEDFSHDLNWDLGVEQGLERWDRAENLSGKGEAGTRAQRRSQQGSQQGNGRPAWPRSRCFSPMGMSLLKTVGSLSLGLLFK